LANDADGAAIRNNGHTDVEVEVTVLGAKGARAKATPWRTGNDVDLEKGADVRVMGGNSSAVAFTAGVKRREMVSFVI
jgi:S-adenosylhomocysteine hydrolase